MQKKVEDLEKGDIFLDSFGLKLKVKKLVQLKWLGIPNTYPKHKVFFETENGNDMYMNFYSHKKVELTHLGDF